MLDFYRWLAREANETKQRYFDFMKTPRISLDEAKARGMFGPVYHGTDERGREAIADQGFNIFKGLPRHGQIANGYELTDYAGGIPAPIHHLGFGVYFTTIKNIAKKYNRGSSGLAEYFIDAPRLETINFGSPNTMMKWWKTNGYDMQPAKWGMGSTGAWQGITVMGKVLDAEHNREEVEQQWLQATTKLTNTLKSKYDAVWFKGKGFKTLLDGDQVCVYDATNIYQLDMNLEQGKDMGNGVLAKIGDRFVVKGTTATGVIKDMRPMPEGVAGSRNGMWQSIVGPSKYYLTVGQWKDPDNQFDKVYRPLLMQKIDTISDFINTRMNNDPTKTREEHVKDAIDFYLRKPDYNLPSALVERVLKKGERFKK
jgi:hypothetical protein